MRGDFLLITNCAIYHVVIYMTCAHVYMYTCINKMKITVKLQHINCCEQSEHIVHSTQFHLN